MSTSGDQLPAVPLEPLSPDDPTSFGSYRVLGRLGSGGQGDAYLAQSDSGWCVIKRVRADAPDRSLRRAWMAREVQSLQAIDSPLIARIMEADLQAGEPWFAMEFVPGTTLGRMVGETGPLTGRRLLEFAAGLAMCLEAIERAGVIHRDLKPANVMMAPAGVRLIDFGVANYSDATKLTQTGDVVGTMSWMAPEQLIDSQATSATDLYAWGLLVHFAATGSASVSAGSPAATVYQILNVTPQLPEGLPAPLPDLVQRALSKAPGQRPSASELVAALTTAQPPDLASNAVERHSRQAATTKPNSPAPKADTRAVRFRGRWVLLAVAAAATVLGVAAFVSAGWPPPGGDAGATTSAPPPLAPPETSPTRVTRTPEPQPTVTVTKTSESAATPTAEPSSEQPTQGVEPPDKEPKPDAWPAYEYAGPFPFDVCLQPDFPVTGQLLAIGDGQESGTDADSEIIRSAQAGLRSLNYGKPTVLDATGYFGPATQAALTSFQTRKGLIADGQLGQQSWSELNYWVNHYAGNCP